MSSAVECSQVRQLILEGSDGAEVNAHLETCQPCQELAASEGRLAGALKGMRAPTSPQLDPVFAAVQRDIAQERGALATLRALSTATRRVCLIGAALLLTVAIWLLTPRSDLGSYPAWHMGLSVGGLGVVCFLALWHALRPLHRPPLQKALVIGLVTVGVLVPTLLALTTPSAAGAGGPPAQACFTFGSVLGLPVLLLAVCMRRAPRAAATVGPLLLVALGAGMVGNMVLLGHCNSTERVHLLTGHSSVAMAFLAVALAACTLVGGGSKPVGE